MPEVTIAQAIGISEGKLPIGLPATYATYRIIRKQPTIALARALSVAPIVAGQWSVEADDGVDDERIKFIQGQFLPIREVLLEQALFGGVDYGWQPFEIVFEAIEGMIIISKIKPLLPELTEIMVIELTGAFDGFKQDDVRLPVENTFLVSWRTEGTLWYGNSLLENIRSTYNEFVTAAKGAARYDKKIAGAHFVIRYPVGSSINASGSEEDNGAIAKSILKVLESSGSISIPLDVSKKVNSLQENAPAWDISILSDGSPKQYAFDERFRYFDRLLVRGLLMPERAILEGQFGTKADAGKHGDLALTNMDLMHRHITRLVNWHLVNRLLVLNYGIEAENTIRLAAAPLSEDTKGYLQEVYKSVLASPIGASEEIGTIDTDQLKDKLDIPKSEEVASISEPETGRDLLEDIRDGNK